MRPLEHARAAVTSGCLLVALSGCGDVGSGTTTGSDPATSAGASSSATPGELIAAATVLEAPGEQSQLCLGGVAESLPPQCGGPVIPDWDWDAVPHESAAGTSWGDYVVIGTYDGERFTLTRDPVPRERYDGPPLLRGDEVDLSTPCVEPPGGWTPVDPRRTTEATLEQTVRRASAWDGYAGLWVDQSVNAAIADGDEGAANDPRRLVLNVRVVGSAADRAAAEAALRETWGGALCVSSAKRTEAELLTVQEDINRTERPLASAVTWDAVTISVALDDGSLQSAMDERYGAGVVRVHSALQPHRD